MIYSTVLCNNKFKSLEHTSVDSSDPSNPSNEDVKKAAEKFLKNLQEVTKQEGGENIIYYY